MTRFALGLVVTGLLLNLLLVVLLLGDTLLPLKLSLSAAAALAAAGGIAMTLGLALIEPRQTSRRI